MNVTAHRRARRRRRDVCRRREGRRVVGHGDRERTGGAEAPWLSVTVQFTVVVPIGNVEPDAGTQTAAISAIFDVVTRSR